MTRKMTTTPSGTTTKWTYNNNIIASIPEGYVAFVYLIENKINGKKYIGKKGFYFTRTKKVKGKNKRVKIESDWQTYWSSSDQLKKDVDQYGEENFTREILHLVKTKGLASYLELREQIDRRVLEEDNWYNNYIHARIHGNHIK
jgi:hypothetical protein